MRIAISIAAFLLVAATLAGRAPAQGGEISTAAVMPLSCTGLSASDAEFMGERLMMELQRTGALEMMERNRRDELLREHQFQRSGACDALSCLVEAGRLLAVQKIVGGSVGRMGQAISVQVRLVDLATGKVERIAVRDYSGGPEVMLTRGMREVALELMGRQPPQARDSARTVPAAAAPAAPAKPKPGKKEYARVMPASRLRAPKLTYGSMVMAAGFGALAWITHRQAEGYYQKYRDATSLYQLEDSRRFTEKYDGLSRTYTIVSVGCAGTCAVSAFFRKKGGAPRTDGDGTEGAASVSLAMKSGGFGLALRGGF